MDVSKALELCGGAARRPALARLGIDDASLRRAVRAGILQPARGLYALPTAAPGIVSLLRNRELLTCVSAAPHYGLWALHAPAARHVYIGARTRSGTSLPFRPSIMPGCTCRHRTGYPWRHSRMS